MGVRIGILRDGYNLIGERVVTLVSYKPFTVATEWTADLPGHRVIYKKGWSRLFNQVYYMAIVMWRDRRGKRARLHLPEGTTTVREYFAKLGATCPDKGMIGRIRNILHQPPEIEEGDDNETGKEPA